MFDKYEIKEIPILSCNFDLIDKPTCCDKEVLLTFEAKCSLHCLFHTVLLKMQARKYINYGNNYKG